MLNFFWVFIGGGIGSMARYGVGISVQNWSSNFPYGTLIANALACLLLGFATEWALKTTLSNEYRLFLMTGLCGGFSTFSTFSNETVAMFTEGSSLLVFFNIAGNILICVACIYIGMRWAR